MKISTLLAGAAIGCFISVWAAFVAPIIPLLLVPAFGFGAMWMHAVHDR